MPSDGIGTPPPPSPIQPGIRSSTPPPSKAAEPSAETDLFDAIVTRKIDLKAPPVQTGHKVGRKPAKPGVDSQVKAVGTEILTNVTKGEAEIAVDPTTTDRILVTQGGMTVDVTKKSLIKQNLSDEQIWQDISRRGDITITGNGVDYQYKKPTDTKKVDIDLSATSTICDQLAAASNSVGYDPKSPLKSSNVSTLASILNQVVSTPVAKKLHDHFGTGTLDDTNFVTREHTSIVFTFTKKHVNVSITDIYHASSRDNTITSSLGYIPVHTVIEMPLSLLEKLGRHEAVNYSGLHTVEGYGGIYYSKDEVTNNLGALKKNVDMKLGEVVAETIKTERAKTAARQSIFE